MFGSSRFAALLSFVVLGSFHIGAALDRGKRLDSRRSLKKSKGCAKVRDLCGCEMHSGHGKQIYTSVPPLFPDSLAPGDFYVSLVDKPILDIVDVGFNTCQIVSLDVFDDFETYELSCHLLARGKFGTFTGSGDGAPNSVLTNPQPALYAITGGTGEYMGAWGEFSFIFDELLFDEEKQKFTNGFDFNLTLCYWIAVLLHSKEKKRYLFTHSDLTLMRLVTQK